MHSVAPVLRLATQLHATNFGSPGGITKQDQQVRLLWHLSYYLSIPLGLLVIGLVVWCVVRYRMRPGHLVTPRQFQYHIPLEITYTIIPLLMVATIFGYMYHAEDVVDAVAKNPPVRIRVEGFQWGWRFTYLTVNGHPLSQSRQFQEVGSVANEPSINDDADLPVLTVPAHETVELDLFTADVNHSFYIPETLFKRDLIQGVSNTINFNFVQTGRFIGECTQFCGPYHPFMRFVVDVMPAGQFNSWASRHKPGITYAGHTAGSGIPPDLFGRGQ
jgi:cytochrome c oxidase subunit 2